MSYNDNFEETAGDVADLRAELLTVQASNVALAAIIAQLQQTAQLEKHDVHHACSIMCDMDAHTEMVTHQFADSIIDIAREIHGIEDEDLE